MRLAAAVAAATVVLLAVVAGAAGGLAASLTGAGAGGARPSRLALADIPPDYLVLYQAAAATCPGLDWSVLAAVGDVESDHGRLDAPGVRSGHNEKGRRLSPGRSRRWARESTGGDTPCLRSISKVLGTRATVTSCDGELQGGACGVAG